MRVTKLDNKVFLNHDPFGRWSTVRSVLPKDEQGSCHWCGQHARFVYGIEQDSQTFAMWDDPIFCSIQCRRSYYA